MRFIRKKVAAHYESVHSVGREHIARRPYIVPIFGLLLGVLMMGAIILSRPVAVLRPSIAHVVFLSDNGNNSHQTLDTKAKTVGDLINKMPQLHLIPQDVVEPSPSTPIVQDNFRINIYRARPVTVIDQNTGLKTVAITAQRSPRVVAQTAGQTVYPEDNVSFAPGDVKQNILGEEVVIDRATPVQFNLYGTPLTVRTHTATVADLLKERKVVLTKDDTLTPAANTPITAGMQISVVRNGVAVTNVVEDIPVPVQYVNDSSLTLGATAVRQAGAAGKEAVAYQVVTQNGVVTSRTVIQRTVITPPVPEIIARGTIVYVAGNKSSIMAAAGIPAGDYGYADYIVSHESNWTTTAYNPSGAYGLCQALPGSKMSSAGADWQTNPVTQLRWCNSYANGTYGGWYGAYIHWVNHRNW